MSLYRDYTEELADARVRLDRLEDRGGHDHEIRELKKDIARMQKYQDIWDRKQKMPKLFAKLRAAVDAPQHESQARRIIEEEASTLVIHFEDPSTDFLTAIYQGLGYPVIRQRTDPAKITAAVQAHSRIFMLGHGSPHGLFGVEPNLGEILAQKKDGLYIWCHADAYAHKWKLSGLVSGMFISEVGEVSMNRIRATQEEVDASNAAFSKAVRQYLDTGAPPSTVRQCYSHATCQITKFNQERLYVFEKGAPSPELHKGSWVNLPKYEPTPGKALDQTEIEPDSWWKKFKEIADHQRFPLEELDDFALYDELLDCFHQGMSPELALDHMWTFIE